MPSKFSRTYMFFTTIVIAVFLLAYSSNPPNGRTNAPGDGYCEDCHLPGNPLGLDGELTIENFPSTIDPNTDYTITVRLTNPNGLAFKGGFQAVVLDSDNSNTGDITVSGTNPSTTTSGGREYVEHTPSINFPPSNEVTWDFTWTSPNGPDAEVITLYAAGNIANGGAGNANDLIRSTAVSGTLTGGSSLSASIIFSTNVSCNGGQDGSATVLATDGTPPYFYSWPDGTSTAMVTNLAAGDHTVTVTDNLGATVTATASISEPSAISTSVTSSTITCTNSTSTATINSSGGTPGYTYLWPSGGTNQTESGLTSGTYTVTVTDANACTDTETFSPPEDIEAPIADIAPPPSLTCAVSTVTLDASASSSGPNISYQWTTISGNIVSGEQTQFATVDQAGTYTLTVTNLDNGCLAISSVVVTSSGGVNLSIAGVDVTCNGDSNGSINLTVSGGDSPYNYQWDDVSLNGIEDPTGLSAGQYCVTVTDANSCSNSICVTINEPTPIEITGSTVDIQCNGFCNGQITATATGGSPAYSYEWNTVPVQTSSTVVNLCSGTYTVTVTDTNGCTAVASFEVTEPNEITISVDDTENVCPDACDGSIAISVNGGAGIYDYQWNTSPIQITQDISNLCAGTYTVTVTDENNCTASLDVTITETDAILLSISSDDVLCNGGESGYIDLTVSGGQVPFTFNWDDPPNSTTEDLMSATAGQYCVTVTDGNDCTETICTTVNEPDEISITGTGSEVCSGECSGSINIEVNGGTGPYTYLWNTSPSQITQDIDGLCAGNYIVTVTDDNGCSATSSFSVTQSNAISITATIQEPSCHGICDGAINIEASGGSGNFTYEWSTTPPQTSQDIDQLCAGTYTVTVTDDNGCSTSNSFSLSESSAIMIAYTISEPSCNNSCDGEILPSISGGVPPYTFAWSNGSMACDIQNICAGNYTVTVTDDVGCTATESMIVVEPDAISITFSSQAPTCFGVCNGSIDLEVAGGTPGYSFNWNTGQTTQDLSGLCEELYTVTVTDENGCTAVQQINILGPDGLSIVPVVQNASCNGLCDGAADLTVTGGIAPYTFSWNNGSMDEDPTNLCAGTNTVTVTDAIGCSAQTSFEVTEPSAINISATSIDATCGECNGSINASVSGGTAPYQYLWSNSAIDEDPVNLCAGTYSLTVTDFNGCTETYTIPVLSNSGLVITGTVFNTSCFENCDGYIDTEVNGGSPPYSYQWDNGLSGIADQSNLCAGTYTVIVTDSDGCSVSTSFTVTEPDEMIAILSPESVSCNGECNGSVQLTVTGGTGNYTFEWSNGSTVCDLPAVCTGSYSVIVTDENGCTVTGMVVVDEPEEIIATASINHPLCAAECSGSIFINVSGGIQPYSYLWSNGDTNENQTGLCEGDYQVTITDANNCTKIESFTLIAPSTLSLTGSVTDTDCNGICNGLINLTASGGTMPYTFLWSDGSSNSDLSNVCAGIYSVTLTDANGCSVVNTYAVNEPEALQISITSIDNILCNGECNGFIGVTVIGGTAPYTFTWNNGSTGCDLPDACAGTYTVVATDINGCTVTATATITEPDPISLNFSSTEESSPGTNDGTATANVTGGASSPIVYQWNDPGLQDTQTAVGLAAGEYCVTITDDNGCSQSGCTIVESGSCSLTGDITSADVSCFGGSDGAAAANASGGIEPYSYSWSNGSQESSTSGLSAGLASVTISDASGCSIVLETIISEPTGMMVTSSVTGVSCNGICDGVVDITVSGGLPPYSYSWDGPCEGPNPNDVCAGTFTVIITDSGGCSVSHTVTISEPPLLIPTVTCTPETEQGANDGTCTVTTVGGTPGYTEDWSNGVSGQTTISDLSPGIYCVTITDSNGCTAENCGTVGTPGCDISLDITSANTCFGACTGSIDLTVNNGTAPFTYDWDPGIDDIEDQLNLCSDDYFVTVTDANGCTATASAFIAELGEINGTLTYYIQGCAPVCQDSIDAFITGGSPPYSYSWSNGETTPDIGGLCPNINYSLTVEDANNCIAVFEPTIIVTPDAISAVIQTTNVSCFGDCDGSISLLVDGGFPPYEYDWNIDAYDGLTEINNVCPDEYFVIVTDAGGCSVAVNAIVTEPDDLEISVSTTNACFGECDGTATIIAIGGTGPYLYSWSGDPEMLCPGTYSVTVTDANGCTEESSFDIFENPELFVSVDEVTNEMETQGDGAIDITVSGGSPTYSYDWILDGNTVSNDEDPNDLVAGTYYCEITDANGCIISTEEIVIDNIVNVLEIAWANQIKVFPNPAQSILYVDFNFENPIDVNLEVFDIRGIRVLDVKARTNNLEKEVLDLGNLPSGVFTLRIASEDSFYTFKIVKIE